MKIVAISDCHRALNEFDIPDGDILIHAGDCSYGGATHELERFNEQMKELPHPWKVFIPGNHDKLIQHREELARKILKDMIVLIDESIEIEGIKIYGSPWTPRFFDWAFMLERSKIAAKWDLIPADTDILVTHGPPFGILDKNFWGESCGCGELRRTVLDRVKPKYHIFGHIHESNGVLEWGDPEKSTTFINASLLDDNYAPVFKPTVFEFQKYSRGSS